MNENWYTQWRIMLDRTVEQRQSEMKRRLLDAARRQKPLPAGHERDYKLSKSA
jgi:hypothetical protein